MQATVYIYILQVSFMQFSYLCFRDWFGEGGLWEFAGFLDAATENEGLCT